MFKHAAYRHGYTGTVPKKVAINRSELSYTFMNYHTVTINDQATQIGDQRSATIYYEYIELKSRQASEFWLKVVYGISTSCTVFCYIFYLVHK